MASFPESIAGDFHDWAFPIFKQEGKLLDIVESHPDIPDNIRNAFVQWAESAQANFLEVQQQTENGYGLPELETLRAETCYCIIHGQWQAAICLTNVLLELFLKLMLIYSNQEIPKDDVPPISRLLNSLSAATEKYSDKDLSDTINMACTQGLISKKAKKSLHVCRERLRNAFFHADMKKMFGDMTTPVTGADFAKLEIEQDDVPIPALPLLFGEALWQNAQANAIPYFREVDGLIRETLPKVFPEINEDKPENMKE